MSTARERAREAAVLYCKFPGDFTIGEIADQASDVWEEHIREIRSAAESLRFAAPELIDFHLARIDTAVKEALGE